LHRRGIGYARVIHKKIVKNGQVSELLKQWVLRCPLKKERNE
jgi:hypothetical protein